MEVKKFVIVSCIRISMIVKRNVQVPMLNAQVLYLTTLD